MSIGSFFSTIWSGIKSIKTLWTSSAVGSAIDTAALAAWEELETIAPQALAGVAETGTTAILAAMGAGAPTSVIIASGISAAEQAFAKSSVSVTSTTLSTFTSALHTAVATPQTTPVGTPAQFAAIGPASDLSKLIPEFEALAAKLKADADSMRASQA